MVSLPRLIVAAPGSGHGKTTVATGLMAALAGAGLKISGHKAGPDYIDPGYHALATGRPGRNLDPVLCGDELMVPLLRHGAAGADIAIVEGVMGLYDGRGLTGDGSTAHLARLIGAPVLLVVDAAAQGRSAAALVAGFAAFEPGIRLGGVVLNRVGSDRHEEILRAALAGIGVPVLGALRRDERVAVPSRHLGLVPAAERGAAAAAAVRGLGALIRAAVDLDAVVALASGAGPLTAPAWAPPVPPGQRQHRVRPVVAIAGGGAFTFGYAETTELLAAAGAEVVTVDPLRDERLPPGTAALVAGGGFPEEHASELSANETLRADIARLVRSGRPVAAECAGLLYLAEELDGSPMCGVLPVTARMTSQLTLGYRDAIAAADSVLAPAGLTVRGHEFHRTAVWPDTLGAPAWNLPGRTEGFVQGSVHASYLHLHWASQPDLAARLVEAAA